jgi:hypothetical protein
VFFLQEVVVGDFDLDLKNIAEIEGLDNQNEYVLAPLPKRRTQRRTSKVATSEKGGEVIYVPPTDFTSGRKEKKLSYRRGTRNRSSGGMEEVPIPFKNPDFAPIAALGPLTAQETSQIEVVTDKVNEYVQQKQPIEASREEQDLKEAIRRSLLLSSKP